MRLWKVMETQSPSFARITSGWIASSYCWPLMTWLCRPIAVDWFASCQRTEPTVLASPMCEVSVYITPFGSLSPKRFSGILTLMAVTSKVFAGAPAAHGLPGSMAASAGSTAALLARPPSLFALQYSAITGGSPAC